MVRVYEMYRISLSALHGVNHTLQLINSFIHHHIHSVLYTIIYTVKHLTPKSWMLPLPVICCISDCKDVVTVQYHGCCILYYWFPDRFSMFLFCCSCRQWAGFEKSFHLARTTGPDLAGPPYLMQSVAPPPLRRVWLSICSASRVLL